MKPVEWEWACQIDTLVGWRIVGVGPTTNQATAEEDFRAWSRDFPDGAIRLVRRPVGDWIEQ
jgi:hypothetical protein